MRLKVVDDGLVPVLVDSQKPLLLARLPLPVVLRDLAAGDVPTKATVHVLLTPRPDLSVPPAGADAAWVAVPLTCRVVEGWRVECTLAWFKPGTAGKKFATGVCDYLIHAVGK